MSRLSKAQLGDIITELRLEVASLTATLNAQSPPTQTNPYTGITYKGGMWCLGDVSFKTLKEAKEFKNGR